MLEFIQASGHFGILSIIIGAIGIALALAELASRGKRSFRRGIGIAAMISLLVGLTGTAFGFYIMAEVLTHTTDLPQAQLLQLWWAGFGVTMTTTVIGSLSAIVNLLALAGLSGLERRWCAVL